MLPGRSVHLKERVAKVKPQMQALGVIGEQMKASADGPISLTDPDARSMATGGRGTGTVGQDVQTVADARHHRIVAREVTSVGHARDQLASMAKAAKSAACEGELIALAGRGYDEGYEILECERAGAVAVVPKPMTSSNLAEGLFDKRDLVYDAKKDWLRCPAGRFAIYRLTSEDGGKLRRQTVEHVFGTLKAWMGASHFPTRTRPRVTTEMSLQVLACNLKRATKILGAGPLIAAMRA